MAASTQYNLRGTVRLPVHIQGDQQFLADLLAGEASTDNGISDDSLSSLNCSAIMNDSDSDTDIPCAQKPKPSSISKQTDTEVNTGSTESEPVMQHAINSEILNQLQALGKRFRGNRKTKL